MKLIRRILFASFIAGLMWTLALAIVGLAATPKSADVAIVFGNRVLPSGQPSPRLRARLDTAANLFRSRKVRRIIVSGGIGREGFDESAVMKEYLVGCGVPAEAIFTDSLGVNTARTCANSMAIMSALRLRRANVVTQYFHIPRATAACRRAGIEVVGAAAPRFFELRDLYSLPREAVAFPVYLLKARG